MPGKPDSMLHPQVPAGETAARAVGWQAVRCSGQALRSREGARESPWVPLAPVVPESSPDRCWLAAKGMSASRKIPTDRPAKRPTFAERESDRQPASAPSVLWEPDIQDSLSNPSPRVVSQPDLEASSRRDAIPRDWSAPPARRTGLPPVPALRARPAKAAPARLARRRRLGDATGFQSAVGSHSVKAKVRASRHSCSSTALHHPSLTRPSSVHRKPPSLPGL